MRELNDLAKAQGRYLGQAFLEIAREPGSILDVPLTPEAEERIRRLDDTIAGLKRQRDASRNVEGKQNAPSKLPVTDPPQRLLLPDLANLSDRRYAGGMQQRMID